MESEEGVAAGTDTVSTGEVTSTEQSSGINPAWNDLLNALPSSLHSQAIPHLRKWDEGVQNRFQQVQSQYAPYRDIVEAGTDPGEIMASVQLAQMIANNPREFYDRMGSFYGEQWGLNQSDQGQESSDADEYSLDGFEEDDLANNPLLQKIQEQQNMLATVVAQQYQQQEDAKQAEIQKQADAEVESNIAAITEKYGEVPPNVLRTIIALAVNSDGNDLMAAADNVFEMIGTKTPAPTVMSPGGGVPSQTVDPASLDNKGTRNLVMQILAQNAANG